MILHASIPAEDPERVARVVAELWRGEARPFPPTPGGWMAFAYDGAGTMIEAIPRRTAYAPGPTEQTYAEIADPPPGYASHLLIASPLPPEEILAIGRREGWPAVACRRGGPGPMGFDLVELWIEGSYMLEVAPPHAQAEYLAFMNGPPAREMFGLSRAA